MSSISIQLYLHDAAANLQLTIESVLKCMTDDTEFYIVYEGTDEGFAKLAPYVSDARIRIERRNEGIVNARRHMLNSTSADYILPLCGNTLLLPEGINRLRTILDQIPVLSGVYGKVAGYDLENRKIVFVKGHTLSYFKIFSTNPVPAGALLIRRAAALQVNGYVNVPGLQESPVGHDSFFHLRLALNGTFHFDNTFIGAYLWRGEHQHTREQRYRDSRIYRWRRECRGDIMDTARDLVGQHCIDWFRQNNRRWFDDIESGAKLLCSRDDIPVLLAVLGAMVENRQRAKQDIQNVLQAAVNMGINDFGIPMALIDYCINGNALSVAEQVIDQALPIYKDDPYAGMELIRRKIQIIGSNPARQEALPEAMGKLVAFEQLYRGTPEFLDATAAAISAMAGNMEANHD